MKKLRVIVCGSTFGQYYIRALQTVPDEFEVVGLLANGSNRSKLCADFYHVPLEELLDLRTESEIENIFDNFSQEYIQYSVEMRKKYWHKQYYSI